LRRNGRQLAGVIALAIALLAFISIAGDESGWMELLFGWTASLTALALLTVGVVLLLGPRVGYWSAEALVGAELFLLALQAGTFVVNNAAVTWRTNADGADGGLVGWALGSLLVSTLGRTIAFIFVALVGLLGLLLLVRYTPFIYVVAYAVRVFPFLRASVGRLLLFPGRTAGQEEAQVTQTGSSAGGSFVPAVAPESQAELPWDEAAPPPAPPNRARRSNPITGGVSTGGGAGVSTSPTHASPPPIQTETTPTAKKQGTTPNNVTRKSSSVARPPTQLPPIDLLSSDSGVYAGADVRALQQQIETTLSDFNVPVRVVHVETGPTVTQFGVEPLFLERAGVKRKVRVSRIVNLADDLALALAAPAVRIEAPVPGRPYVGIEVPNPDKTLVGIRGIMESPILRRDGGLLALPLGRNTAGSPVVMDLTRAPHLLIAGATGSGKSVCINTVITGLLMQHGPETLRFVMVDPKRVELPGYNGIPQLLGKVITDMEQVMGALTWLLLQMDDRYRLFREVGVRHIDGYNQLAYKPKKGEQPLTPLPYIVLVVDELADLMMTAADDVERQICRLAQMARATGIHLILATQRPSVDVVTGLIKANFPSRIAFAVTSQIDSRVILDMPGAERLLGRGDMLLMRPDQAKLIRVQGCYVADEEINRVSAFWKQQTASMNLPPLVDPWSALLDREDDDDELLHEAVDALRGVTICSASMLQRKLRIGYPKAARLMEQLEAKGIVGPDMGAGQGRAVLLKGEAGEDGDDDETVD
jgi:S-DNA-T family DNA segregation ATPase FtsK/SpoIIIE